MFSVLPCRFVAQRARVTFETSAIRDVISMRKGVLKGVVCPGRAHFVRQRECVKSACFRWTRAYLRRRDSRASVGTPFRSSYRGYVRSRVILYTSQFGLHINKYVLCNSCDNSIKCVYVLSYTCKSDVLIRLVGAASVGNGTCGGIRIRRIYSCGPRAYCRFECSRSNCMIMM